LDFLGDVLLMPMRGLLWLCWSKEKRGQEKRLEVGGVEVGVGDDGRRVHLGQPGRQTGGQIGELAVTVGGSAAEAELSRVDRGRFGDGGDRQAAGGCDERGRGQPLEDCSPCHGHEGENQAHSIKQHNSACLADDTVGMDGGEGGATPRARGAPPQKAGWVTDARRRASVT
jgi:hypothetical protein